MLRKHNKNKPFKIVKGPVFVTVLSLSLFAAKVCFNATVLGFAFLGLVAGDRL
jgi:hypothetical protein